MQSPGSRSTDRLPAGGTPWSVTTPVIPDRVCALLATLLRDRLARGPVYAPPGDEDLVDLGSEVRSALAGLDVCAARYRARRTERAAGAGRSDGPDRQLPAGSEMIGTVEAAETLRVSDRHVRRLVAEGRLPAHRVGGRLLLRRVDVSTYRGGADG